MKPIYKELMDFTKKNGDLIRKPIRKSKLITKFKKEYELSVKEVNIFFIVFSAIMSAESYVDANNIRDDFELSFEEYVDFLNILETLRSKGMVVFGEKNITGTNFNPALAIDNYLSAKLIFGKDPLDNCKLNNPYSIIEYVANLLEQRKQGELSTSKLHREISTMLSKVDKKLSTFHNIRSYSDDERVILLIVANEYLNGNISMLRAQEVAEIIEENNAKRMQLFSKLLNGNLEIIKNKYIKIDDTIFMENPMITLSKHGASQLFNIKQIKQDNKINPELSRYIKHKSLASTLYFPNEFQSEISRLKKALKFSKFNKLIKELERNNHSKGFVSLFYGAPGTGKTASVYEIANTTKRDILQVDIEKIRNKYVGESEKRLAQVFEEYKEAKETLEQTPILLFNEADALLGQRIGVSNSVDQMNNSMQNI